MFSEEQKHNFIEYCLENYPNMGQGFYIYIQIEDEEEEQEPILNALPIALEFFLFENPDLQKLGEEERNLFFEYLYGDFNLNEDQSNINDLALVFEGGKKKRIYEIRHD